jgi:hypothetical protein
MAQFVPGDRGMEHQVGKQRGNQGFRTQENEAQHLGPGRRLVRDGQHRGDERGVERHENVIGDHPAFLQEGMPPSP